MVAPAATLVVRADASDVIGLGHVVRSLALARGLQPREIQLICKSLPESIEQSISSSGVSVVRIQDESDFEYQPEHVVLVDHYGLDVNWHQTVRQSCRALLVVDDMANREVAADILVNPNLIAGGKARYKTLANPSCVLFVGPQFALLREEFFSFRSVMLPIKETVEKILITFGGADPTCETEKCLEAVDDLPVSITLVVGGANSRKDNILLRSKKFSNVQVVVNATNMAELITQSDLIVSAGGSSIWERCFLGRPGIGTVVAENQAELMNEASSLGAVQSLGWHESVTSETYRDAINLLISNPSERFAMAKKGLEIMGAADHSRWQPIKDALLGVESC